VPIDDNEGGLSDGGCQNCDSRIEESRRVEGTVEGRVQSTLLAYMVEDSWVEGTA